MLPSADANDASEEELEAESRTRGERGAHTPASSSQPGWEREGWRERGRERERDGEMERWREGERERGRWEETAAERTLN